MSLLVWGLKEVCSAFEKCNVKMQLLCLWWRCIVPERKKKVVLRSELTL